MVRKIYEVICDYGHCKAAIGHYPADSIKEAVEWAIEDGAVASRGKIFCDKVCQDKYEN